MYEADGVDVAVGVALIANVCVGLVVSVGVATLVLVAVAGEVAVGVIETGGVPVSAAATVAVDDDVDVADDVGSELASGEFEAVGTMLGVGVALPGTVIVTVSVGDIVADGVAATGVNVRGGVTVATATVPVKVTCAEAVGVDDWVALAVADAVVTIADGVGVELLVADALAVGVIFAVTLTAIVGVALAFGVALALVTLVGVTVGDGVVGANDKARITETMSAAVRRRSPLASCCAQVAMEKIPSIALPTSADVRRPLQSASALRSCALPTPTDNVTVAARAKTREHW